MCYKCVCLLYLRISPRGLLNFTVEIWVRGLSSRVKLLGSRLGSRAGLSPRVKPKRGQRNSREETTRRINIAISPTRTQEQVSWRFSARPGLHGKTDQNWTGPQDRADKAPPCEQSKGVNHVRSKLRAENYTANMADQKVRGLVIIDFNYLLYVVLKLLNCLYARPTSFFKRFCLQDIWNRQYLVLI